MAAWPCIMHFALFTKSRSPDSAGASRYEILTTQSFHVLHILARGGESRSGVPMVMAGKGSWDWGLGRRWTPGPSRSVVG